MLPDEWLRSPREWSTEQWDLIGYVLLALFVVWVGLGDPEGLIFLLIFGFMAFLIWSGRDQTK